MTLLPVMPRPDLQKRIVSYTIWSVLLKITSLLKIIREIIQTQVSPELSAGLVDCCLAPFVAEQN